MSAGIETAPAGKATATDSSDRDSRLVALRSGRGLTGVILVAIVVLAGLLAPWLAPYAPDQQFAGATLADPSGAHLFGTDSVGRDILSRTLHGIRIDLLVIFVAVPLGALVGALLGLAASRFGWLDTVIQRAFDLVLAFPAIVLAIALTMVLGPGVVTIGTVIVLAEIPVFGRLTRTSVLTVRQLPYVEAARALGAGEDWILRRHVLPNCLEPVTVQLALAMSVGVFMEGAMSFLGLGVTPPAPSLGSLIKEGTQSAYHSPFFEVGPLAVVIALRPRLLIADEPTSALDVSVQADVLALFSEIQQDLGFACLFISHDLAVVHQVADRVAVLRSGSVIEVGPVDVVFTAPSQPHTRALIAAIPMPDPACPPVHAAQQRPVAV